jgi:hypothetical protein
MAKQRALGYPRRLGQFAGGGAAVASLGKELQRRLKILVSVSVSGATLKNGTMVTTQNLR